MKMSSFSGILFLMLIILLEGLNIKSSFRSGDVRVRQTNSLPVACARYSAKLAPCLKMDVDRRVVLRNIPALLLLQALVLPPRTSNAIVTNTTIVPTIIEATEKSVTVPIEYIPALGAYVVNYYLFGEPFSAIVDTGSPFLTAPSTCSKWSYKHQWGCYHPELTYESGYANTIEGFDNNQGPVVWRKAEFAFGDNMPPQNLTFGVFGPELLDGPGGLFLGLIRDTDSWIRPSFLQQMGYTSFSVDLCQTSYLTLSKQTMIADDNYIPLVRDLSRKYKAPVVHYTAKAAEFIVNGLPLQLDPNTPTYVIFDTGVSGMAVSTELFDGRSIQARKNKEKTLWGEVSVKFKTNAGDLVELTAKKPITTPLGHDTPWTRFKGNLIVLGLAFLVNHVMTVDIDGKKVQFTSDKGAIRKQ